MIHITIYVMLTFIGIQNMGITYIRHITIFTMDLAVINLRRNFSINEILTMRRELCKFAYNEHAYNVQPICLK